MKWIVLIGDETLSLATLTSIRYEGEKAVYCQDQDRACIEFDDGGHVFLDVNNDIPNDYEPEDKKKLPSTAANFIMLVYTRDEHVGRMLSHIGIPSDIYVDNDHGTILPIHDFIRIGMPLR